MTTYVLDSSAVLAILFDEPGAEAALAKVSAAPLGAANLVEVVTRLIDIGMDADAAQQAVADLELTVEPVTREDALAAGALRLATRPAGLSLGDRLCLALAHRLGAVALTADRNWARLDIGVEIELIR